MLRVSAVSSFVRVHMYMYIYIVTTGYLALYPKYLNTVLQCWLPGGG